MCYKIDSLRPGTVGGVRLIEVKRHHSIDDGNGAANYIVISTFLLSRPCLMRHRSGTSFADTDSYFNVCFVCG